MTTDSSGEEMMATDQPLFRVGDPSERFESVVHSLLVLVAAYIVGLTLVTVGIELLAALGFSGDVTTVMGQTALQFAGFILVSVSYIWWRTDRTLVGFQWPDRRDLGITVIGSLVLIAFMLVAQLLLARLGVSIAENVAIERGRDNPVLFLYYIPLVLLLFVPGEELLFRGVIQGLFRGAYGIVPGVLAASVIFGLIHYPSLVGQGSAWIYVGIAGVSGIILGVVYEFSGNILVPILVHAVWNTIVYLTAYLETIGSL